MMGRYILPWFGGSAAVWSASMASNQTALVAGQLPNLRGGRTVGSGPYTSRIDYHIFSLLQEIGRAHV